MKKGKNYLCKSYFGGPTAFRVLILNQFIFNSNEEQITSFQENFLLELTNIGFSIRFILYSYFNFTSVIKKKIYLKLLGPTPSG